MLNIRNLIFNISFLNIKLSLELLYLTVNISNLSAITDRFWLEGVGVRHGTLCSTQLVWTEQSTLGTSCRTRGKPALVSKWEIQSIICIIFYSSSKTCGVIVELVFGTSRPLKRFSNDISETKKTISQGSIKHVQINIFREECILFNLYRIKKCLFSLTNFCLNRTGQIKFILEP